MTVWRLGGKDVEGTTRPYLPTYTPTHSTLMKAGPAATLDSLLVFLDLR
jgi:hypothetical protein